MTPLSTERRSLGQHGVDIAEIWPRHTTEEPPGMALRRPVVGVDEDVRKE